MVDKAFYSQAAEEVAAGKIDQALWIKISAEHAGDTPVVRQAKYIQQRARDLAIEAHKNQLLSTVPRAKRRIAQLAIWVVPLVIIGWLVWYVFEMRHYLHSDYQEIVSGAGAYPIYVNELERSKKEVDRLYQVQQEVGKAFEFKDGTTVADKLDFARSMMVQQGGAAMGLGYRIQSTCRGLKDLRESFLGTFADSFVYDPKVEPICQLWTSNSAPMLTLHW